MREIGFSCTLSTKLRIWCQYFPEDIIAIFLSYLDTVCTGTIDDQVVFNSPIFLITFLKLPEPSLKPAHEATHLLQ